MERNLFDILFKMQSIFKYDNYVKYISYWFIELIYFQNLITVI